jgi:hypothetical protein
VRAEEEETLLPGLLVSVLKVFFSRDFRSCNFPVAVIFDSIKEIKGENFVQRVKDLRSQNEKFQMVLLMKKD